MSDNNKNTYIDNITEFRKYNTDIGKEYIVAFTEHKELPKIEDNKFYFEEDEKFIAVDNSSNECFVEEFNTEDEAKIWLSGIEKENLESPEFFKEMEAIGHSEKMIDDELKNTDTYCKMFESVPFIASSIMKTLNIKNLNDAPDYVTNALQKYLDRKNIERTRNLYTELQNKIPINLKDKYSKVICYSPEKDDFDNFRDLPEAKKIVETIPKIENSKEKMNVLVYWSESTVFNTYAPELHKEIPQVFTINEMEQKYDLASKENDNIKRKEGLNGTYLKTKFAIIYNDGENFAITRANRMDIGDDYQTSFHDFIKKEYGGFDNLENSFKKLIEKRNEVAISKNLEELDNIDNFEEDELESEE